MFSDDQHVKNNAYAPSLYRQQEVNKQTMTIKGSGDAGL
jgi:hypothetical protein